MGCELSGVHSGHLVGAFPHEKVPMDKIALYTTEGNAKKMRSVGKGRFLRYYISEVHLIDPRKGFGGFFEQLSTVG